MTSGEPPRRNWLAVGVSIAAFVMIGGFSLFVLRLMDSLEQQSGRIVAAQRHITGLERVLSAERLRVVELYPQPGSSGSGRILWSPAVSPLIVSLAGVSPPPEGHAYHVWMIDGPDTASAGVLDFSTNSGGIAVCELHGSLKPSDQHIFAVTLEPRGGIRKPTNEIIFSSSVTR